MKKIFPPAFFMDTPDFAEKLGEMVQLLQQGSFSPLAENGQYAHWEKVRFLPSETDSSSPEDRWQKIKFGRFLRQCALPLADSDGKPFWFCQLDQLAEFQHWFDEHAAGARQLAEFRRWMDEHGALGVEKPASHNDGLINEAIASSQLEGASTTRVVAHNMLAKPRPKPVDESQTMILNNYRAMEFIRQIEEQPLSLRLILELHRILTEGLLPDDQRGRLRQTDNIVVRDNMDNKEMHRPPPAAALHLRLEKLCDFANGKTPEGFLHPALRAVILHFMLAFEHPFADGNGRTARVLFYWAMAHNGYWLMSFVSISQIIHAARRQYYRAFMHSETDGGDLTYFLLHQTNVIRRGFERLAGYIKKQSKGLRVVASHLEKNPALADLNGRQMELLRRALQRPDESFSAREHRVRHRISYPSARSDLLTLADKGLLIRQKTGREYLYFPSDNLRTLLKS